MTPAEKSPRRHYVLPSQLHGEVVHGQVGNGELIEPKVVYLASDFDAYRTRIQKLLRLQRRYIKFLSREEGKGEAFLMIHGMGLTEKSRSVILGKMYRQLIAALDAEIEEKQE